MTFSARSFTLAWSASAAARSAAGSSEGLSARRAVPLIGRVST